MSLFSNKSFGAVLVGTVLFSIAAAQGCSSDAQTAPPSSGAGAGGKANGGAGGKANGGAGGKANGGAGGAKPTAGTGNGGDAGDTGETGTAGAGGEGGSTEQPACDQSFDNTTLTAISDNGGKLPALP